jgi:Homing endonuclease associated repeat
MSAIPDKAEIICALRAAAVDGVAPSSTSWKTAAHGRPHTKQVATAFGSWSAAITAAGLRTPWEAARARKTAEQREQRTVHEAARRASQPGRESNQAKRRRERSETARQQMLEDVESGRLVIRQASAAERERFTADRAAAAARLRAENARAGKQAAEVAVEDEELLDDNEETDGDEPGEVAEPVVEGAIA